MTNLRRRRYCEIVAAAERHIGRWPSEGIRIHELSLTLKTSQYSIRRAFYFVHGISPYRFFYKQKLSAARDILLSSSTRETTVTRVATDLGFRELGRFAVQYRRAFGESPSATLRREEDGFTDTMPIRNVA